MRRVVKKAGGRGKGTEEKMTRKLGGLKGYRRRLWDYKEGER